MTDHDTTPALAPQPTRRGRIIRGLLAGVTFALVLALLALADGGALALAAWAPLAGLLTRGPTPVTVTKRPPAQLAASAWQRISLPFPGGSLHSYAVAPNDPRTVFACAAGAALWRTRDSGAHWTRLALPGPLPSGTASCWVHIAASDPRRVALLVEPTSFSEGLCDATSVYLSTDGGNSWTAVRHPSIAPAGSGASQCDVLLITARHLFLTYFLAVGAGTSAPPYSLLERSDDDGQTWVRADNGLGGGALFFPTLLRDDTLVTASAHQTAATGVGTTELWLTRDAGAHWQRMSTMPDFSLLTMAAEVPGVGSLAAGHPVYGLVREGVPSNLLRLRVVMTPDGRTWSELPPLPLVGSSSQQTGLTSALGVDATGRLFAFGVAPAQTLPLSGDEAAQALDAGQQLWVWDPAHGRWETAGTQLPVAWPHPCASPCWTGQITSGVGPDGRGHGTYVWVQENGMNTDTGLYRLYLPAA